MERNRTLLRASSMQTSTSSRRQLARQVREAAALHAYDRNHPDHIANGDERADWHYAYSFTKGLRHDADSGMVANPADFEQFVRGVDSGDPRDFADTPAGHDAGEPWRTLPVDTPWRAWESQGAGLTFDLQGPDAQAVGMPPAPKAGSTELTGEIAEVYAQAVLRDSSLSDLRHGGGGRGIDPVINDLNRLDWFNPAIDTKGHGPSAERRRVGLNRQTAFRGQAPGDTVGPYLSQFMLLGTPGLGSERDLTDGIVQYGGQSIDQRVHIAEQVDFMTTWPEWLDVQDGADLRGAEKYIGGTRFITTGRDISTYVHYDALYQAYLNACLIMLNLGVPFDPGVPFQRDDQIDRQQGFAQFGGPHILSLVTEVATRALKAVRYQKFNVHRRPRPEVIAARLEKADHLDLATITCARDEVDASGIGRRVLRQNKAATGTPSLLLPMAFPEGSPMHPSYGAGHATVAGACVTVLKAFFDHSQGLDAGRGTDQGWVASKNGCGLTSVPVYDETGAAAELTIEGELNKLASNISIGRNWAGVHYYSDYWESLKMGEQIALGILEEQKLGFRENFSMTIPLFGGGCTRI